MANPIRPPKAAIPNMAPPRQWGLPPKWPEVLARRFEAFCEHVAPCFQTKTRDGRAYGFAYLKSQLRLESSRTFTSIAHDSEVPPQNLQHFMSYSPWSAHRAMELIQQDLRAIPALHHGSVLIVDKMADEKAGDHSAGAGLQYNGAQSRFHGQRGGGHRWHSRQRYRLRGRPGAWAHTNLHLGDPNHPHAVAAHLSGETR